MHQRKSFLNSKYKTAHIDIEGSINLLFRYGAKRSHLVPYACIGKDNGDLLQVLSGGQIEALPFSSTAEELLSKLPKRQEIVQASQAGAPQAEPALYRKGDGLAPRAIARKLDENLTATLKARARREGTT